MVESLPLRHNLDVHIAAIKRDIRFKESDIHKLQIQIEMLCLERDELEHMLHVSHKVEQGGE